MEIPDWTSPIDCPACGASSETGLAVATVIDRGVDVACACGLLIVDGSITNRGADRPLEDLYNDTRWPVIGWLDPPAYRAPAERRYALRLVPVTPGGTDAMPAASAAPDRPVTSVTIRFNRAHRPGGIAMTPYRAVQRAIRLVIVATALALGTAALLWAVLGHAGIALPFPTILAAVALVAVWSVVSSSGSADRTPPPSPPPGPPRVPPTWADAERMASLHRQGLISREELDRVLRELVPPGPPRRTRRVDAPAGTEEAPIMDRLLSTREVAELIGNMSPRFVQREAASGRLRCQAIGAGARPTLRFLAADVELWRARYARERPPSEDPGGTDLTPRRPGREAP